jgi:hypothetical protein
LQTLLQNDQDSEPESSEEAGKVDVPYRAWFVAASITAIAAIWSTNHYELFAKVAWTVMWPGFTFSQTLNERHDLLSRIFFGILLLVHWCLMQFLYPFLPAGHYGYILVLGIVEIMTIGLAYQVWIHLRSDTRGPSPESK